MKILVINGPNLNLLGKREPGIYGNLTLEQIEEETKMLGQALLLEVDFKQSNHEGFIVDWIQQAEEESYDGILINAGAYTHTSIAIHDAIKGVKTPVLEIHLSNIYSRESFRHHSYISAVAIGQICGFGKDSYLLALRAMKSHLDK